MITGGTLPSNVSLSYGLEADKPENPKEGAIYLATDTGKLFTCFVAGSFESIMVEKSATITTGTYIGNNTSNRAIPHGLGVIPKSVFIACYNATDNHYLLVSEALVKGDGNLLVSADSPDDTYFYVGDSAWYSFAANETGHAFRWVAMA